MYRYISFLIVLGLFCTASSAADDDTSSADGQSYSYAGFGGGYIEIKLGGSVEIGDYGVRADFCNLKSEYYCVDSDFFHFAVPKNFDEKSQSWVENGHEYRVLSPTKSLILLGKQIEIAVIASTHKAKNGKSGTTYYYYSHQYGLLAFESVSQTKTKSIPPMQPAAYISTSFVGFGSAE